MPYSLCPICGSVMHLNVGDPVAWFAKLYPDVPFGTLVPGVCYDCFHELSVGDTVEIRGGRNEELHGRNGTIVRIDVDPKGSGSIYFVNTGEEPEHAFIRAHLRKHNTD